MRLSLALSLAFSLPTAILAGGCSPHYCNQRGQCIGTGADAYCFCEHGYTASDCSRKLCPKSDDPLTTPKKNYRVISLTTASAKGVLDGVINISFNGEDVAGVPANGEKLTPELLAAKLQTLPNIETVEVSRTSVIDEFGGTTYQITFIKFPIFPHENNIYTHDGNPSLDSFSCDESRMGTDVYSPQCIFKNVQSTNVVEYTTCSNHGTCSERLGECKCDPGWKGRACDDNKDGGDVEALVSDGPFFTGNVLKLGASRDPSAEYDFVKATASYDATPIYTLSGTGSVTQHIGDLTLQKGSVSVTDGDGIAVTNHNDSQEPAIRGKSSAGGAHLTCPGGSFSGDVLSLSVEKPPSPEFNFISSVANGNSVFTVAGDGRATLSNSLEIQSGKVTAPSAIIGEGGMQIVSEGDLVVGEGGRIVVKSGSNILNSGQNGNAVTLRKDLNAQTREATESTLVISHDGQGEDGSQASAFATFEKNERQVFSIGNDGETNIAAKLTVTSGGVSVGAGGVAIDSGGLTVAGGITLKSGDLKFESSGDEKQHFNFGVGVSGEQKSNTGFALSGKVVSDGFSGNVLDLEGAEGGAVDYNFLEARSPSGSKFTVDNDGNTLIAGSLTTEGDVRVHGDLDVRGGTVYDRHLVVAGDVIEVDPSGNTFVEVNDDNAERANKIIVNNESVKQGQVLLVKNNDKQKVIFAENQVDIPSGALLMFIYTSPSGWTDVTAAAAHSRDLNGVTKLVANNDLEIGDYKFSAGSFVSKDYAAEDKKGKVVVFGAGGVMQGVEGLEYKNDGLTVNKITVGEVVGDVDFRSSSLLNAQLVNSTIDGLRHLTLESLIVTSLGKGVEGGVRFATVDSKGLVNGVENVKWDETKGEHGAMRMPSIGGNSKLNNGLLTFESHLDFKNNTLKNAKFEKDSVIADVKIVGGSLTNAKLVNVTADGLEMGFVEVEGMNVRELSNKEGEVFLVGKDGKLVSFHGLKVEEQSTLIEADGTTSTNTIGSPAVETVSFNAPVNMNGQVLANSRMIGGSFSGVTQADFIGSVDVGGSLNAGSDVFIDGGLTVSGSVLGSGPYVDASDQRFKKNVRRLGNVLDRIRKIDGVSYSIDGTTEASKKRKMVEKDSRREIGFIAQNVELAFPELVETAEDGYKGVAYARMAAVLVEGMKELEEENRILRQELSDVKKMLEQLL